MSTTLDWFISRSACDTGDRCQWRRYLEYDYMGRGIKRVSVAMPLATGTYVHDALAMQLLAVQKQPDVDLEEVTDKAVDVACESYHKEVSKRGFQEMLPAALEFALAEQTALTEAIVRGFGLEILPKLVERFQILDVEREELLLLGNIGIGELQVRLWLEGTSDADLMEKETGDIYIISFKTTSQIKSQKEGELDPRQEKATRHDMQGMTESLLVEARLHEELAQHLVVEGAVRKWASVEYHGGSHIRKGAAALLKYLEPRKPRGFIQGILPVFLLKGKRYENKYAQRKEQYSPLIRIWRNSEGSVSPEMDALAWAYEWQDREGKNRRLGKGWKPAYVWELPGGVKAWLAKLAMSQGGPNEREPVVQPEAGFCLPKQIFIPPLAIKRDAEAIQSWRRQTLAKEAERIPKVLALHKAFRDFSPEGELTSQILEVRDEKCPQEGHSCHYPSDCPYLAICYEKVTRPLEAGYWWRVSHHKREREYLEQQLGPVPEMPEQRQQAATELLEDEE